MPEDETRDLWNYDTKLKISEIYKSFINVSGADPGGARGARAPPWP